MATQKKEVEIRKCDWCDKEVSDIENTSVFIGWYKLSQTVGTHVDYKVGTHVDYKDRFVNTKDKDFCCVKCLREAVDCETSMK